MKTHAFFLFVSMITSFASANTIDCKGTVNDQVVTLIPARNSTADNNLYHGSLTVSDKYHYTFTVAKKANQARAQAQIGLINYERLASEQTRIQRSESLSSAFYRDLEMKLDWNSSNNAVSLECKDI